MALVIPVSLCGGFDRGGAVGGAVVAHGIPPETAGLCPAPSSTVCDVRREPGDFVLDASVIIAGIALVVSLAMGGLGYATITASRRAGGFQADALPADVQAIIDKMRDEMQTRHDQEMAALRAHYEMMLASNQHKIEELEARVDWLYSQLTGAGGKMPPRESV